MALCSGGAHSHSKQQQTAANCWPEPFIIPDLCLTLWPHTCECQLQVVSGPGTIEPRPEVRVNSNACFCRIQMVKFCGKLRAPTATHCGKLCGSTCGTLERPHNQKLQSKEAVSKPRLSSLFRPFNLCRRYLFVPAASSDWWLTIPNVNNRFLMTVDGC